jgi:hypothetical protein
VRALKCAPIKTAPNDAGNTERGLATTASEVQVMVTKILSAKARLDDLTIVTVRRQWNDWKTGTVRFNKLRDFHRRSVSGGVQSPSPRPMLYARMFCDSLLSGEIGHSCAHGQGPHDILVCIVKKDNAKIFADLEKATTPAGEA